MGACHNFEMKRNWPGQVRPTAMPTLLPILKLLKQLKDCNTFYILHLELETRQSLKSAISQIFSKQIKNFHKITFVQNEKLVLCSEQTKLVGTPCISQRRMMMDGGYMFDKKVTFCLVNCVKDLHF